MSLDPFDLAFKMLQYDRERERMQMQAERDYRTALNAERREDRTANHQQFDESLKTANAIRDTGIKGEEVRIKQEDQARQINEATAALFAKAPAEQVGSLWNTGADSSFVSDRASYGPVAMQRYLKTPEAASLARVMGFENDPTGFARAIDNMASTIAAEHNTLAAGNVPVLEKSYEGPLAKAHQVASVADTLGIKSPLRALHEFSSYNSADNPHADLQRLAIQDKRLAPAVKDALGGESAIAKVNSMVGGDALKASGLQNQAAFALQTLAKDMGVDPTTMAAAVANSPELLDTFLSRYSTASHAGAGGSVDTSAADEMLRAAATRRPIVQQGNIDRLLQTGP
jgi:hypothetical protein